MPKGSSLSQRKHEALAFRSAAELVVALEPFAAALVEALLLWPFCFGPFAVALEPHLKSLTVAIDLCRGKDNYVQQASCEAMDS